MKTIEIKRGGRVVSTVGFGAELDGFADFTLEGHKLFLIYDSDGNVEGHAHALSWRVDFAGKFPVKGVSEERKNMDTVLEICRWLLASGADRNSVLVALGGGILLDIVGFVAGIYKRGVRCIYIPTTLLAQVDAAIGGKTGVNLDGYKNILGVFRQPELIYICRRPLATLPDDVFRDGLAEMVKTFIIDNGLPNCGGTPPSAGDTDLSVGRVGQLLKVVRRLNEIGGFSMATTELKDEFCGLVASAVGVKAGIVERDELEGGERRKLNLGHTFAHAIEYVSHSRAAISVDGLRNDVSSAEGSGLSGGTALNGGISHGEAVAMGLAMAARLSVRLGVAEPQVERDVVGALEVCGLPTVCPYPIEDLLGAMSKDKKAEGDKIHFVLVRSIGDVVIKDLSLSEIL